MSHPTARIVAKKTCGPTPTAEMRDLLSERAKTMSPDGAQSTLKTIGSSHSENRVTSEGERKNAERRYAQVFRERDELHKQTAQWNAARQAAKAARARLEQTTEELRSEVICAGGAMRDAAGIAAARRAQAREESLEVARARRRADELHHEEVRCQHELSAMGKTHEELRAAHELLVHAAEKLAHELVVRPAEGQPTAIDPDVAQSRLEEAQNDIMGELSSTIG